MTIHPLFTIHTLRPLCCSPTCWISSKRSDAYSKTFCRTLSNVRVVFWILSQLDILCTSAVKRCYTTWYTVQVSPVFRALEFMKARKTCHRVDQTSVWSISYSSELCNKNCIVKTSITLIVRSALCYTAGSDKSDAMEGVPDWLLKRATKVFRVQSKEIELLLTYWCSYRAMIVNFEGTVYNNWTSCLN